MEEITHPSDIIGDWGPLQKKMLISFWFIYVFSPNHNYGINFYAPKIDYQCEKPEGWDNITIIHKCNSYENPQLLCDKWVYDKHGFEKTIIDEWDLVCDQSWLPSFTQTCYQLGYAVSSLVAARFSDKYGRLTVLKVAVFGEVISGFSVAFSGSIMQFSISRFLLGLSSYSKYLSAYLLVFESVGVKNRAEMVITAEYVYPIGMILFSIAAYFLTNFRHLQGLYSAVEILAIFVTFKMEESPRWLLINGKYREAEDLIIRSVKTNLDYNEEETKMKIDKLRNYLIKQHEKEKHCKQGLFQLYKVPKLAFYSILLYIIWFIFTFVFYGLSLNLSDLGGNIFLNFFFLSICQLLSLLFLKSVISRFNRKTLLICFYFFTALSFFIMIFTYENHLVLTIIFAMIGRFFSVLLLIYIYTAEIFPTSLRQTCIGACSFSARFGSTLAPFAKELTQYTSYSFTLAIFSSLSMVASALTFFLPETKNKEIPDTINESVRLHLNDKNVKMYSKEPDVEQS